MPDDVGRLNGARVLITGSGRGLGAALAMCLAEAGCDVVLSGRHQMNLERVAVSIAHRGLRYPDILLLDLADLDDISGAVAALEAGQPVLDILIHNGAEWLERRKDSYSPSEVAEVVNSAISGTFLLTQTLLPLLLRSHNPQILTIGSVSALDSAQLINASVPFVAAKRGQRGLMSAFEEELSRTPIRFHSIHPPQLLDIQPNDSQWSEVHELKEIASNRDVVEAALFALTRPPHISLSSIVLKSRSQT